MTSLLTIKKLYFIFYVFYILIIKSYSAECPRETPIKKNNKCVLEFCSYNEYLEKICILDNPIVKKQFLKDIKILGEKDYKHLSLTIDSSKALILESSYDRYDISTIDRQFYGINATGEGYFNDKFYIKLNIPQNINRKSSEISKISINYKDNYIVNIGAYTEVYDYTSEKENSFYSSSKLFQESIFSERNFLYNIEQDTIFGFISGNYFKLLSFNLSDTSLPGSYTSLKYNNGTNAFPTYIVSCFVTKLNSNSYIICFYRNLERKLVAGIYDINLEMKASSNINDKDCYMPTNLFFKCIHLIENSGVFIYFVNNDNNPLLQIKKLTDSLNLENFISGKSEVEINKNKTAISSKFNNNDIIKLNDTRFAFITTTDDDNVFYNIIIFIFEIFNNNQGLENKLYKLPFNDLYGVLPLNNIRALLLSNTLGIGFTGLNNSLKEEYTYFMFFGYPNGTDHLEPESKVCSKDINRTIFLKPYLFLDNNLFGLELKFIKITKLPTFEESKLNFYTKRNDSDSETNILKESDYIGINDPIIVQITEKLDKNYTIEYIGIATDPSFYSDFNELSDADLEDSKKAYYSPFFYEGRKNYYKFSYKLIEEGDTSDGYCCHKNCLKNECNIFGVDSQNYCLKCKENYYFNESDYFNSVPKVNNCIIEQDGYWLNKTHSPYMLSKCFKTCETCKKEGTAKNQNCEKCLNNTYKKENENTGNCYQERPSGYFLNHKFSPPVYSKCPFIGCINCTNYPDSNSSNCEPNSCNFEDNYFSFSNDETNCTNSIARYYLEKKEKKEDNRWKPCHEKCEFCYGNYNATDMNCSKCINGFYLQDGTNNCYSSPPEHYFFNSKTKSYSICAENCINCNSNKDSCISCKNGTLMNNSLLITHPFCQLDCPVDYVFNPESLTCTKQCPNKFYYKDSTNHLCINCYKYYDKHKYFDLDNSTRGCIEKIPQTYIYDPIDNNKNYIDYGIIEKCFTNCQTCSRRINKSSENNQNCLTCANSYYLVYGTHNCQQKCDPWNDNYYVHDESQKKCINCKKENANTPEKKIYKIESENKCINEEVAKNGSNYYIIDDDTGTIGKCHENCLTCKNSPTSYDNNCLTCDNSKGYYKKEYTNDCIFPTPEGYFIDPNDKLYKSCSYGCKTCSGKGQNENNKCLTCKENYYFYAPNNACISNCDGYYKNYDECLDIQCLYYNHTKQGNTLQMYFDPNLSNKCSLSCGNNKYMFENIYVCFDNCSDIYNYINDLLNIEKYYNLLNKLYLEMPDDYYFYEKDNEKENNPKVCYAHFEYFLKDNNNRIKGSENYTQTNFYKLNNNTEIDLELVNKLYQTQKIIDFEYNHISYSLEIFKDNSMKYIYDNNVSYFDLPYCYLDNNYILKWDIRLPELYSNYISFNFYRINDSVLIKENYSSICPDLETNPYIIESPINLDKLDLKYYNHFALKNYDIYDINSNFYEFNCEPDEFNGYDINLQTKVKYFYIENITQENCVYSRINSYETRLVEKCYFNSDNLEYKNILNERAKKLSSIKNDYYFKNNNYHLKLFKCFEQFALFDNITNFLFFLSAISFICKIIFLIIYHCKDVSPIKTIIKENFVKKQVPVQEERMEMVELKPPVKKKDDIISLNKKEKKKYNYIIAVVKNEKNKEEIMQKDDNKKDDVIPDKKDNKKSLKETVSQKRRHNIKNLTRTEKSTIADINQNGDIEYFEYDVKMEEAPKQFRERKYMVEVNKIMYELSDEIPFEQETWIRFLLENIPITSIFFLSKNNTGYRRFKYESHFANCLFFLTILSTLVVLNLLFFSDNLILIKYENKKLAPGNYIPFSIYSALINVVIGFLFIILILYLQKVKTKDIYNEEKFENEINKIVEDYRCRNLIWQMLSIIFGILSLYYLTVISNIYPNMRTDIFVQILLSFIFENIFYLLAFSLCWILMKYIEIDFK